MSSEEHPGLPGVAILFYYLSAVLSFEFMGYESENTPDSADVVIKCPVSSYQLQEKRTMCRRNRSVILRQEVKIKTNL